MLSLPWIMSEAQAKKTLETLFGWGVNFSRAMILSKTKPASGRPLGWMVKGGIEREYSVFAAPSHGIVGLFHDPSADLYSNLGPTNLLFSSGQFYFQSFLGRKKVLR